ncbi:MAG: lipid-binding SYLF domain-containing protein [Rhodospirillales bacterium]
MRNMTRTGMIALTAAAIGAAGPALAADNRDMLDATVLVQEAAEAVAAMKTNPEAAALLQQAKGVYVVPDYAEGGIVVGGAGGNGVMSAKQNGVWTSPTFYDIASVTAGAQVGFTAGPVVMLLMTDQAINDFKSGGEFSLSASAGYTMVDASAGGQVSTDGSDVVIWSDTQGIYAGLTAGASDISWDEEANDGYYGVNVEASQVIDGMVTKPEPDPLGQVLSK